MLIDTHLHLDAAEFDTDRAAVMQAARETGVERFILPAVDIASCIAVQRLVGGEAGCHAACGIHPLYVDRAVPEDIERLQAHLSEGWAVAVGEIGLDGFVAEADPLRQEWFFIEQLKLARQFDLPVLLHVRRAQDRILGLLRRHRVRGGIAHAFNGSVQQAEAFIKLGFRLGFGGAMTYSGSTRIRKLAAELPGSALVLESDAPDIPPAWDPVGRNVPANVARFAQILAGLRGADVPSIAQMTSENACAVLGIAYF